jgi:hypothetical protein
MNPDHDDVQDQKLAHILRTIDNNPELLMPTEDEKQAASRTDFWMKVAGISFGLWSFAIGFAIKSINDFQQQFSAYVLVTERRVTLLEERQAIVLKRIERIEMPSENRNGVR